MTILNAKSHKFYVIVFFIAYLLLGLTIYDDYGVSWDEPQQRFYNGEYNYRYVFDGGTELIVGTEKYHGPFFELILIIIEKTLNLDDSRDIYLMRHLVTFLMFYIGVCFFYLLCRHRFNSWQIALTGCLFFILSPRIFAHSFYNSKDIAFLSFFIISIFTLVKFLDKKTVPRAVIHAIVCAMLIDIRILGIIVPFFTFLFIFSDAVFNFQVEKLYIRKTIISLLVYTSALIAFTILFWPILWEKPLYHFSQAFLEMSRFHWERTNLYLGSHISASAVPWHYIPVWILITTPVLYSCLFFMGLFIWIKNIIRQPSLFYFSAAKRMDLICLLWFFLPLFAVIILHSVLYDAWRHMFFIYPAFLLIALTSINPIIDYINSKNNLYRYKKVILLFVLLIGLSPSVRFMIQYHPHQNLFFNRLAGKNFQVIKNDFDMDYWGLSYRKAIEYILKNDKDNNINIYVEYNIGYVNANIIPNADRARLNFVKQPAEAEYYLSTYRFLKKKHPYKNEYFTLKINDAKIMVVYKI